MNREIAVIMQDKELRRSFGLRLKELRKQRRWTQKDLAAKVGVRFAHLNKYESGLHVPPVEKLLQLAELFDTSVDYLLTGDASEATPLHNVRLIERFRELENFEREDQEAIIMLIDAMIVKRRVEGALLPLEKHAG